jgi:hypothetical protein
MFFILAGTIWNGNVTLTPAQLLCFLTGARRIRVLPRLEQMIVTFFRCEEGQLRLPWVATCSGHLRMPIYNTYEQFKAAWTLAISEETFAIA